MLYEVITFNVAAPTFLKFNTEPEAQEFDLDDAFVDDGDVFDDEEIRITSYNVCYTKLLRVAGQRELLGGGTGVE